MPLFVQNEPKFGPLAVVWNPPVSHLSIIAVEARRAVKTALKKRP